MAKLTNYQGSVELIAGIKQKNNGNFPLIEANAIQVDNDGKRLDTKLSEIDDSITTALNIGDEKLNIPKDDRGNLTNGESGQILQSNGDGTTQWVNKPTVGITEETDPTVPEWAKQPTKPTYNVSEVEGALDNSIFASDSDIELYFNTDESITMDNNITATDTEAESYLNVEV